MTSTTWKINRIKAMGGQEIIHRIQQQFLMQVESLKLTFGWQPLPSGEVTPKHSLLHPDQIIATAWKDNFILNKKALFKLACGQIDFWGHSPIDIGYPVNWHKDPVTQTKISIDQFGKKINYRDDALVGDIKTLWELGRHQHLQPLAAAYAITGSPYYKNIVANQIEDWITNNPFGWGIHWCSALEVSLRLISWSIIHSLFFHKHSSGGLFDVLKDPKSFGISIYQHAWFVANYLSRHSSANNHLIGELTGLWTASQVFNLGKVGNKWAIKAQKELENEAKKRIFDDGVNKEQATYYHLWVLEYLLFANMVAFRSQAPFSRSFEEKIHKMANFLRFISPHNGSPPQIGDSDDGFVSRFDARWPQNPYKDVLDSESLIRSQHLSGKLSEKTFWYAAISDLDLSTINKIPGVLPRKYPVTFPYGGYGVLGNTDIHVLFNAGSLGYPSIAAHGHADALSVCIAINGKWWLVDPGTYAYHNLPYWRNYFRSTSAHNTIEIAGQNQSQIGGPFLWLNHAKVSFGGCRSLNNGIQETQGYHDGYKHLDIIHKRTIRFNLDKIEIFDLISGTGKQSLSINYHFAPDTIINETSISNRWIITKADSTRQLKFTGDKGFIWQCVSGKKSPIAGWYSPALNKKIPAPTLNGKWNGTLPVEIISTMNISSGHDTRASRN